MQKLMDELERQREEGAYYTYKEYLEKEGISEGDIITRNGRYGVWVDGEVGYEWVELPEEYQRFVV